VKRITYMYLNRSKMLVLIINIIKLDCSIDLSDAKNITIIRVF